MTNDIREDAQESIGAGGPDHFLPLLAARKPRR